MTRVPPVLPALALAFAACLATAAQAQGAGVPPPPPPADDASGAADAAATDAPDAPDASAAAPPATSDAPPPPPPPAAEATPAKEKHETNCSDGVDNDGDLVTDCGDFDCHEDPVCKADGKAEDTPERCSDWIDNDKDGVTDCDDSGCQRFAVCRGSWKGPVDGNGDSAAAAEGGNAPTAMQLAPGVEAADSNDGIGFVGVRFGVVAGVVQDSSYDNLQDPKKYALAMDAHVNLLQLRAFGQLPLLEDSYFLVSIRGDVSPRLTYAMFQVPLGGGHYLNINTGGGSLSNALIISAAKQPLLEPAFWMLSAFEPGNSAAVEVSGPLLPGALRYRAFAGGGAGFSSGNVGNRHFQFTDLNYTYTLGAQLQASPVGKYDRFDSPYLYKESPLAVGIVGGAKYEQREQERFPAVNGLFALRWGRFEISAEDYAKAELNFGAIQNAYDVTLGVLIIPEWLFLAVDGGQFYTSGFGALSDATGGAVAVQDPPKSLGAALRTERGETDLRAALHFYFWRNNGVLSTRYTLQLLDPALAGADSGRKDPIVTHTGWLSAQFRF